METRRRILQAAEAIFAERGFSDTSLDAVAEAADVHQPGIFYHFPNKRALYEAVVGEALAPLEKGSEQALVSAGPPRERLLDSISSWVDILTERPGVAKLILHEARNPEPESTPRAFSEVGRRIQVLIEAAFEELEIEPQADDAYHFTSMITGSTLFYAGAMQQMLSGRRTPEIAHSMRRHKELLLASTRALLDELERRA